ncbi:hypothetical protein [Roseimicrobium sp. ORNL1]|uniref:hypothetical protein n=1 Tax=Roseimicrobium sp. ORNL1 TaxID=2711231 RepID=UPI0013E200D5|nr:hypothetical protein [Roseimicrobium sp. ORNL1]QIF03172.1 hypothetical protein G5S37_17130 [Roseimicrobium sp. ORNL1]
MRRLALFLVVVGLVAPFIPQLASLMGSFGWGVYLALLIASLIIMVKGAFFRGCLGILFAVIVLPLWVVLGPLGIRMATDERGWKQVLLEEAKKHEVPQDLISKLEQIVAAEGMRGEPGSPGLPSPESVAGGIETITSKDGRTIRGTIEAYEAWGVTMKREDGQIVNITFELMSAGDMQKFRDRYNNQQR